MSWELNSHYLGKDRRTSSKTGVYGMKKHYLERRNRRLLSVVPNGVVTTLLLDETGLDGAAAAYSIRKLRAAYTGDCMRLRRSSDNGEDNVQFDSNGEFSLTSPMDGGGTLADWVTTDDAFVVTWYDQSENTGRNVTQATSTAQPKIISTGSILLGSNSKPAMTFDGVNDALRITYTQAQPVTLFYVMNQVTWTNTDYLLDGGALNAMVVDQTDASPELVLYAGNFGPTITDAVVNTWGLLKAVFSGAASDLAWNDGSDTTGNASTATTAGVTIGANGSGGGSFGNVSTSELIIWPSDLDGTTQGTAKTNINTFYTLY